MPQVKPEIETFAKINVVGVGGSGGSAVSRMVKSGIRGVEFWAMNTDVQALQANSAPRKVHIGKTTTRGLGAGMNPEIGKKSAEESQNEIREAFKDADMVFITCGLGGGTGSGAAPVIAGIARDLSVLTVAVVTKPFTFEGPQRRIIADRAHEELSKNVDAIITIPNDRILQIVDKKTSMLEAFRIADDVLRQGVQGISETITTPQLINIDFADVKTIMKDTGSALMGIGSASGEARASEAAKAAISSPLLDISIDGARGILFTIAGGPNLGMHEVSEAAKVITGSADANARVIFGAAIDEALGEEVRITVIATGFDEHERALSSALGEDNRSAISPRRPASPSLRPFSHRPVAASAKTELPSEEKESARPVFFPRPVSPDDDPPVSAPKIPTISPRPLPKPPAVSTEPAGRDDLEMPTFIRKRMGL